MKALVGAFNQEKALVGAFSVIVQPVVELMDRFAALLFYLNLELHPRQTANHQPELCPVHNSSELKINIPHCRFSELPRRAAIGGEHN